MEGKEPRGPAASAGSGPPSPRDPNGSVNRCTKFTPVGGLVPLATVTLGEIMLGGVCAGPERHAYVRPAHGKFHCSAPWSAACRSTWGKKIEFVRDEDSNDGSCSCCPASILGFTARGRGHLGRPGWFVRCGPHGFSETPGRVTASHAGHGRSRRSCCSTGSYVLFPQHDRCTGDAGPAVCDDHPDSRHRRTARGGSGGGVPSALNVPERRRHAAELSLLVGCRRHHLVRHLLLPPSALGPIAEHLSPSSVGTYFSVTFYTACGTCGFQRFSSSWAAKKPEGEPRRTTRASSTKPSLRAGLVARRPSARWPCAGSP